ncbi:DUF6515 family protein [Chitinimonas sp.]|uniref:DUF6515 family protein n=1 Tax=Chitinimonas sp. TaxID=1934313 RepID=UPI0035AE6BE0
MRASLILTALLAISFASVNALAAGAAPAAAPVAKAPPPVSKLPADAQRITYCDVDFYWSGGWWYRLYSDKQYQPVSPSVGLYVDSLPATAQTVSVNGVEYRLLNGVYYRAEGKRFTVVEAPRAKPFGADDPASRPDDPVYITPRNGQSRERQAQDRGECDAWSIRVNKFDPNGIHKDLSPEQLKMRRGEHRRALMACLNGRGYTLM